MQCVGGNTASTAQIGDGTTTDRSSFTQTSGLTSGVTYLAVASDHSFAIVGGKVKCWGGNWVGQCGDNTGVGHYAAVHARGLGGCGRRYSV